MIITFRRQMNINNNVQNQIEQQQQQQQNNMNSLDSFVLIVDKQQPHQQQQSYDNKIIPLNSIDNLIQSQQQPQTKFPNVQSYTVQEFHHYSNSSLKSIEATKHSSLNHENHVETDQRSQQQKIENEPDYFQDMVPEFKKPKTIYVNNQLNDELNMNNIDRKFRINQSTINNQQIMINDIDDNSNINNDFKFLQNSSQNQINNDSMTTWESMTNNDEELWINTDEQLELMRQQRREKRINEHRRQRLMKQQQQMNKNRLK